MSAGRLFMLAAFVVVSLLAAMPFIPSRSARPGIAVRGPADSLLFIHHPHLHQVERDLAAGHLSISEAVEIVLPLVQDNYRFREAIEFHGKGLRPGVALMLREWVEKMAEDNSESVQDAVLERLYRDVTRICEQGSDARR